MNKTKTIYPNVTKFAQHYTRATSLLLAAIANTSADVFEEALAEAYLAKFDAFGYRSVDQGIELVEPYLADWLMTAIREAARRGGVAIEVDES